MAGMKPAYASEQTLAASLYSVIVNAGAFQTLPAILLVHWYSYGVVCEHRFTTYRSDLARSRLFRITAGKRLLRRTRGLAAFSATSFERPESDRREYFGSCTYNSLDAREFRRATRSQRREGPWSSLANKLIATKQPCRLSRCEQAGIVDSKPGHRLIAWSFQHFGQPPGSSDMPPTAPADSGQALCSLMLAFCWLQRRGRLPRCHPPGSFPKTIPPHSGVAAGEQQHPREHYSGASAT